MIRKGRQTVENREIDRGERETDRYIYIYIYWEDPEYPRSQNLSTPVKAPRETAYMNRKTMHMHSAQRISTNLNKSHRQQRNINSLLVYTDTFTYIHNRYECVLNHASIGLIYSTSVLEHSTWQNLSSTPFHSPPPGKTERKIEAPFLT